jgi:hypothetical protein
MSITDTLLGEAYYYLKQYYGNSISIPTSIFIPVSLQQKLSQEEAEEAEINESVDKREPIGTQQPGENVLVNENGETIAEMSVTELPTVLSEKGTTASNILGSPSELGENQGKGTNKGAQPVISLANNPIQQNIKSPLPGGPLPGGPLPVAQRPVAQRPVDQRPGAQRPGAQLPVAQRPGGLPVSSKKSGAPLPGGLPVSSKMPGGPPVSSKKSGAPLPGGLPVSSKMPGDLPIGPSIGPSNLQPPIFPRIDEGEIQLPTINDCNENIKTLIKGGKIVEAFEAAYIMDPWPYECIKYILSIWPQDSINIKLKSGSTPLIEAVKLGDIRIVIGLIEKEPNINQSGDDGDTPIIHAARNGNTAILKLIHGQGGSLEQPTERNGDLKETVLMNAVKSGNLESVKYLIEQGVDIHEKTQNWIRNNAIK